MMANELKIAVETGEVINELYLEVRAGLLEQLTKQGKTDKFYIDLVDDYMAHWNVKELLKKDIEEKGLRYSVTNGNGISSVKPNESVQNLQKETATMLKILQELNLKEPIITPKETDDISDYC